MLTSPMFHFDYPKSHQDSAITTLMNLGLSNTISTNTITYENYLYLTTTLNGSKKCSPQILVNLMNAGLEKLNNSILNDKSLNEPYQIDTYVRSILNKPRMSYKIIVEKLNAGISLYDIKKGY